MVSMAGWVSYQGDFVDAIPQGQGVRFFRDGKKFIG
jgi:hypothetical protein